MPTINHCLEALKALILAKNAISVMAPQCAQHISHAVFMQTNRQLSATTILRLYNFLPAKFPPSAFTKEVLAIYCGYENYDDFINHYLDKNQTPNDSMR